MSPPTQMGMARDRFGRVDVLLIVLAAAAGTLGWSAGDLLEGGASAGARGVAAGMLVPLAEACAYWWTTRRALAGTTGATPWIWAVLVSVGILLVRDEGLSRAGCILLSALLAALTHDQASRLFQPARVLAVRARATISARI